MHSMRANSIITTIGCAVALFAAGCIAPWSAPVPKDDVAKGAAISTPAPPSPPPTSVHVDPGSPQPDMAAVLDKIQQVHEMDPAAEQKLLDELRHVPTSSWPLVAEEFRASLAYHEQLTERNRTGLRESQPVVDLRRAPPVDSVAARVEPRQYATSGLGYAQSASPNDDRASAPIGSLVDPHNADSDRAPILARSMPYAMPSPVVNAANSRPEPPAPAQFAGDGPMYPIANRNGPNADAGMRDGVSGDGPHVASQAIAQTIATPSARQAIVEEIGKQPRLLPAPDAQPSSANENWQQLLQKAIADLDHRVSPSPTTTAEVHQHVSLRILRLLAGDTEKALEPIPHISPAEQDYWSRQLYALATYLDHHSQPDDKRRAAAAVTYLDEAVSHLHELGSLSLRNLTFCKNVYGYGAIDPYDSDTFTPGQHVSLYVEIENYHSTPSEKGYSTSLGSTYEISDEKGNRVASGDFPDVNDCCRNRRRDFHIQFGLTVPDKIPPGRYQVQLVIKDRQSDKIGNAKASFEVKAGKK